VYKESENIIYIEFTKGYIWYL